MAGGCIAEQEVHCKAGQADCSCTAMREDHKAAAEDIGFVAGHTLELELTDMV